MKSFKELAAEYDEKYKKDLSTNERLAELVMQYGLDKVSAASGLKAESILIYTTRRNPPKVSPYAIDKAEYILNNNQSLRCTHEG